MNSKKQVITNKDTKTNINIKKQDPDINSTYSDEPEYYENFNEVAINTKVKLNDGKKDREELERYYKNLHHHYYSTNKD